MYMGHITQKDLLLETGFLDRIRGGAAAAKAAITAFAPEITEPLAAVASPFIKTYSAYKSQQPASVLEQYLGYNTDIELVKIIDQKQKPANPKKSWFRELVGPKNVTLITFTAYVYERGGDRRYKQYGEAAGSLVKPFIPIGREIVKRKIRKVKKQGDAEDTPSKTEETTPLATLTAEVFRTAKGLQIGEIYDTKTGYVYHSSASKTGRLPVFNELVRRYRDNKANGYPVKNIIAFLTREIRLNDRSARNVLPNAKNLQDLISKATGVNIVDINTVIPDNQIDKLKSVLVPLYVESNVPITGKTQKQLLEETLLLSRS